MSMLNYLVDKKGQAGECTSGELNKFKKGDKEYNKKYMYGYTVDAKHKRFYFDESRGSEVNGRLLPKSCLHCNEPINRSLYRCNICGHDGFLDEK